MELISQLLAVVAVLALAAAAAWLLRRGRWTALTGPRPAGLVQVIDRKAITPQLSIYVIGVKEGEFVLAVHSSGVTVLKVTP